MFELKSAILLVEVVIGAVIAAALGDYLGYKVGRFRFAVALGIIALIAIAAFTIYAAIVLPGQRG